MRPMIMDEHVISGIRALAMYAEANPFSIDDILDMMNGDKTPPGLVKEHCFNIPVGYKLVYSVDMQPAGRVMHMSLSVDTAGSLPSEKAVLLVMKVLRFPCKCFEGCKVRVQELAGGFKAIEVGYLIED